MKKNKLKEIRKARGFKQEVVAEVLGIDKSNYCRKENGQTELDIDEWHALANFYKIKPSEIYEPDNKQYIIFKDNAKGNYQCTNHISFEHDKIIETLHDYIQMLKKEIIDMKKTKKKQ